MKYHLRFTKKNLSKTYCNNKDCPIADALKDAGVKNPFVKTYCFRAGDKIIMFNKRLQEIDEELISTFNYEQRKHLLGKKVTVEI